MKAFLRLSSNWTVETIFAESSSALSLIRSSFLVIITLCATLRISWRISVFEDNLSKLIFESEEIACSASSADILDAGASSVSIEIPAINCTTISRSFSFQYSSSFVRIATACAIELHILLKKVIMNCID